MHIVILKVRKGDGISQYLAGTLVGGTRGLTEYKFDFEENEQGMDFQALNDQLQQEVLQHKFFMISCNRRYNVVYHYHCLL